MSSPTSRSIKYLEDQGFTVGVVERWIPGANIRRDLWGWCDIVALDPINAETIAVQTTTTANMKARINKIQESDTVGTVRKCGWSIHVHGWSKKKGRWMVKIEDIS